MWLLFSTFQWCEIRNRLDFVSENYKDTAVGSTIVIFRTISWRSKFVQGWMEFFHWKDWVFNCLCYNLSKLLIGTINTDNLYLLYLLAVEAVVSQHGKISPWYIKLFQWVVANVNVNYPTVHQFIQVWHDLFWKCISTVMKGKRGI